MEKENEEESKFISFGFTEWNLDATRAPPNQVWDWHDDQNDTVKQTKMC